MQSISKSKYLTGLQCPKLLWTNYHDKAALPPPDPALNFIFKTGHAVGDLAKQLWPDGVEVAMNFQDLSQTVRDTEALLHRRVPIFEASFLEAGRYVRVDVLVPSGDEAWDLVEVKSSSQVQGVNLHDVAYQYDCLTRGGIKLDRLYLMHVDTDYVRQGEFDVQGFFHMEDVTNRALDRVAQVPGKFAWMQKVLAGKCPPTAIGKHCTQPYSCPLRDKCWSFLPPDNVTELTRVNKDRAFAWIDAGILALQDAPQDGLNTKQLIQQQAVASGKPQVNRPVVLRWLERLVYPLWLFDFETFNPAVPLFDGTRPYQRIPFQFSLHVQRSEGAQPEHVEFLADTAVDPRPALLEALGAIGPTGTVLAFNMAFERGVLNELAEAFPEATLLVNSLTSRLEDLATVFQSFDVHHPAQHGRYSLKNVLPAWTDLSYDGMAIGDGMAASHEFERVVFGEVDPSEKARVLTDLKAYCAQDTYAMVALLDALRRLV